MTEVTTFEPGLEERIASVTERFNQFIARQKAELIKSKEAYNDRVKQLKNEHRELLKQLQDSIQREQELQTLIQREVNDANTTESRLADLRLREKQFAEERVTMEKQVVELRAQVEERRTELSNLKTNRKKQNDRDLPEMLVYERLLGLKIEGLETDALRFVFVNIDPQNPDAAFSLDLDVGEHIYKIKNVDPVLPEEQLAEILDKLNETRDLSQFLKGVRAAFKSL